MVQQPANHDHSESNAIGIHLAIGCVVMVAAACAAAALFPPSDIPARLAVMAATVGGYAAIVPSMRAALGVAGLSVLVFTGFLANRYGELTMRGGDTWWYALLIGAAAALGIGWRLARVRRARRYRQRPPVPEDFGTGVVTESKRLPDLPGPVTAGERQKRVKKPRPGVLKALGSLPQWRTPTFVWSRAVVRPCRN